MEARAWRRISGALFVALLVSWSGGVDAALSTFTSKKDEVKVKVVQDENALGVTTSSSASIVPGMSTTVNTKKGDMILATFSANAQCDDSNDMDFICDGFVFIAVDDVPIGQAGRTASTLENDLRIETLSFQGVATGLAAGQHQVVVKFSVNSGGTLKLGQPILSIQVV